MSNSTHNSVVNLRCPYPNRSHFYAAHGFPDTCDECDNRRRDHVVVQREWCRADPPKHDSYLVTLSNLAVIKAYWDMPGVWRYYQDFLSQNAIGQSTRLDNVVAWMSLPEPAISVRQVSSPSSTLDSKQSSDAILEAKRRAHVELKTLMSHEGLSFLERHGMQPSQVESPAMPPQIPHAAPQPTPPQPAGPAANVQPRVTGEATRAVGATLPQPTTAPIASAAPTPIIVYEQYLRELYPGWHRSEIVHRGFLCDVWGSDDGITIPSRDVITMRAHYETWLKTGRQLGASQPQETPATTHVPVDWMDRRGAQVESKNLVQWPQTIYIDSRCMTNGCRNTAVIDGYCKYHTRNRVTTPAVESHCSGTYEYGFCNVMDGCGRPDCPANRTTWIP